MTARWPKEYRARLIRRRCHDGLLSWAESHGEVFRVASFTKVSASCSKGSLPIYITRFTFLQEIDSSVRTKTRVEWAGMEPVGVAP